MFILNWLLDNLHHPWSSVITPYGAWFSYALASYVLYVIYLWMSSNSSLDNQLRWISFRLNYFFPFFGKTLTSFAKIDANHATKNDTKTFTNGEQQIYDQIREAIEKFGNPSRVDFNNGLDYLLASGDKGRKPMTLVSWLVIVILSSIEMVAIAQMMVDILSNGGYSKDDANRLGWIFGFVLGFASAIFLHFASQEWHKRSVIFRNATLARKYEYSDMTVSVDDTLSDKDKPKEVRLLNRIREEDHPYKEGSWSRSVVSFISVIIILMSVIGYFRYETTQLNYASTDCSVYQDATERDVCESDNKIKNIQKNEAQGVTLAGILMFTVLYIMVLIAVAIYSYQRSFIGNSSIHHDLLKEFFGGVVDSDTAYGKTRGYSSYEPLAREISRAVTLANKLRNKYASIYENKNLDHIKLGSEGFQRTFLDYLSQKDSRGQFVIIESKGWDIVQSKIEAI